MTQRLSPGAALLLTVPPLMWAGNAVVGRAVHNLIPPMTLNFLRWVVAFAILVVLSRGQWAQLLQLRVVAGDVFVLLATACWAGYSWIVGGIVVSSRR